MARDRGRNYPLAELGPTDRTGCVLSLKVVGLRCCCTGCRGSLKTRLTTRGAWDYVLSSRLCAGTAPQRTSCADRRIHPTRNSRYSRCSRCSQCSRYSPRGANGVRSGCVTLSHCSFMIGRARGVNSLLTKRSYVDQNTILTPELK